MGMYLNPGNSGFAGIRNDIYIEFMKMRKHTCVIEKYKK